MLVVDLLHEFELGVWKTTFVHLIRLLYAAAPAGKLVAQLNARYFSDKWSMHIFTYSLAEQVSRSSKFWAWYNTAIFYQCIGDEEIGRS